MGIGGNDRADELAKEATELEPATETTTITKLHRQLRAKLKTEWTIEWARKPIAGRYAISDRIPPSLAGSHAFRTLDRHILGIVTQARTGHGYFGEYYQTLNIQGPINCPSGAGLQTREHIVFECRSHEEYGDIIDEGAPDHQLSTLFGTKTGIDALAEFVKKSKRSKKHEPRRSLKGLQMQNQVINDPDVQRDPIETPPIDLTQRKPHPQSARATVEPTE